MKTDRHFYQSPFPRKENNDNVLRMSRPVLIEKDKENKKVVHLEIPPSLTKSYMNKNPFYFDIKKCKERKSDLKRPKSSLSYSTNNLKIKKSILSPRYTHCVIAQDKLEYLLNNDKNLLMHKPVLVPGTETIEGKKKFNNRTKCDKESLSAKRIIEKILNPPKLSQTHSKFGEVPEYIGEFRIREIIEKEYERLMLEEKNYPYGTTKLLEVERVNILNKLYATKEELLTEIAKFPVSTHVRSIKIQKKKAIVENKLEEIDYAIRMFERNKVFIRK